MGVAKWQTYPRPQMRRGGYVNLNGTWKLEGKDIWVPFVPQSRLAEYKGEIKECMTYERKFIVPSDFTKEKILLHFGAVDEVAKVYVNDNYVGMHEGGYLPFSFDITEYVSRERENTLKVEVEDYLTRKYPYGKQCKKRGGMWYTPISGIWQTVWMENVPKQYIKKVKITPSLDRVAITLDAETKGFRAIVSGDGIISKEYIISENTGELVIENPVNWTVSNPYLYNVKIITDTDEVDSYFALRTVEVKEVEGIQRICLNNQPIFMHGVLDQGYFEDGIFLPEEDTEYEKDILRMKELGFNMLRKHIKIEPEQFYYDCDRLGMLVLQDMVNNGGYSYIFDTFLPTIGFKKKNYCKGLKKDLERKQIFEKHMVDTLEDLYNHPCIIGYTIFNE